MALLSAWTFSSFVSSLVSHHQFIPLFNTDEQRTKADNLVNIVITPIEYVLKICFDKKVISVLEFYKAKPVEKQGRKATGL